MSRSADMYSLAGKRFWQSVTDAEGHLFVRGEILGVTPTGHVAVLMEHNPWYVKLIPVATFATDCVIKDKSADTWHRGFALSEERTRSEERACQNNCHPKWITQYKRRHRWGQAFLFPGWREAT
jgi:hypothetical protein